MNLVAKILTEAESFRGINLYHGGDITSLNALLKNFEILSPEEKIKFPSTGGGFIVLSTSIRKQNALNYSRTFGNNKVLKLFLKPSAKVFFIDTKGKGIDGIFTDVDLEKIQAQGYDAIAEEDEGAEYEYRILSNRNIKVIGLE